MRRVKNEENVTDLGSKPLSKANIAKHCLTLGYVNMVQNARRGDVLGLRFDPHDCDFQGRKSIFLTRILWLVNVATDRDAPLTCANVKNLRKTKKITTILKTQKIKKEENQNKKRKISKHFF